MEDKKSEVFVARCHCGQVNGSFRLSAAPTSSSLEVRGWDCNCSDCWMRGNIHAIIPQCDFTVPNDNAEKTVLYQWGTKVAIRRFCKICGILPWYQPRSNPDSFGVTVRCVDWTKGGTLQKQDQPTVKIDIFDGRNWEQYKAYLQAGGTPKEASELDVSSSTTNASTCNDESVENTDEIKSEEYTVQCHCGKVRGKYTCHSSAIGLEAWECNCSDCYMRRNVATLVDPGEFQLDMPNATSDSSEDIQLSMYRDATISYRWGTKRADRRFCNTCGILPWYRPRSDPESYAVVINCVDWTKNGTRAPPAIHVRKFDGINYDEAIENLRASA